MSRDGLAMPDCADGGQSPQTLKSLRRDLNGSTAKSAADRRRACGRNSRALRGGVAVAEQQQIDLRLRLAVLLDLDRLLARRRRAVDERIRRIDRVPPDLGVGAVLGDRFFRTTSAFAVSAGNRSESWNVRRTFFDSAVVTHSAKPGRSRARRSRLPPATISKR